MQPSHTEKKKMESEPPESKQNAGPVESRLQYSLLPGGNWDGATVVKRTLRGKENDEMMQFLRATYGPATAQEPTVNKNLTTNGGTQHNAGKAVVNRDTGKAVDDKPVNRDTGKDDGAPGQDVDRKDAAV